MPSIVEEFKKSLEQTLGQYRQFGGRLQINDQTGQYTIKATDNDVVELSVKYHNEPEDDYVPSYSSLEMEAFPPMLLDSKKLLPRIMTEKQTLTQHGDFLEDDAPVTMFMVTFIRGGLVLGVGLHHLATDVSGLDGFLQSWAANNRNLVAGLPLAPFDYSIMDRALLTHSDTLPDVERWTELDQKLKTVKLLDAAPQAPPPEFKMPATSEVLFHFPKSKTDQLKAAASSTDPDTWVSSFDSIMALCWRCVSRARQSSSSGDTTTTLMFAVNGRGRLKPQLARHYVGNVAMLSRSELTFDEVVAPDAFPRLAALVRAANVEVDDNLYKSVVEWVAGVPDKRRIGLNMNAFLGPDVVSSSWQGLSAHQTWDFGFGTPKAIRWPKPDLDGFVFYFPSRNAGDPDEGVEMVVCLEDSAMQKLLKDQEWLRAGANFSAILGSDTNALRWDRLGYSHLTQLATSLGRESFVQRTSSIEYWDEAVSDDKIKSMSEYLEDFKVIHANDLPDGVLFGVSFTTVTINAPKHIECLFGLLEQEYGVQFIKKRLPSIQSVFSRKTEVVFNCTGNAAGFLPGVEDTECYPTRGQIVLARAPQVMANVMRHGRGYETYIIPRPWSNSNVIHGGYMQKSVSDTFAHETDSILSRTAALSSELKESEPDVLASFSGLRPSRDGGARVERT
ncbi:D-amino-acid oxidase [Colletotrichum siamense]|nr:D-amino-acid oxidase [Colletotrichum siamense]